MGRLTTPLGSCLPRLEPRVPLPSSGVWFTFVYRTTWRPCDRGLCRGRLTDSHGSHPHLFGLLGFAPHPSFLIVLYHRFTCLSTLFSKKRNFFIPLLPHRTGSSTRHSGRNLGTAWGTRPWDQDRKDKFHNSLFYSPFLLVLFSF